jgi:hypothetical protein
MDFREFLVMSTENYHYVLNGFYNRMTLKKYSNYFDNFLLILLRLPLHLNDSHHAPYCVFFAGLSWDLHPVNSHRK